MSLEVRQDRPLDMDDEALAIILRRRPDLHGKNLQEVRAILKIQYPSKVVAPQNRQRRDITFRPGTVYRKLAENCLLEAAKASSTSVIAQDGQAIPSDGESHRSRGPPVTVLDELSR